MPNAHSSDGAHLEGASAARPKQRLNRSARVGQGNSGMAARLCANAVDCLPSGELARQLEESAEHGFQLRVKLGIDPTAPDIHLGHAVVLRKLREFQEGGHMVVLIVGDYTARVGDPSGRSALRPMLSEEEIDANAETFREQALKILDCSPERLEVRRNSEWLDMRTTELLALARTATAAQLLERDDFARRYQARQPISLLEMLYPLLQGYDSVAVEADIEVGGTDQKFNLLFGRDVQRAYGHGEQSILTMPILVGTDGTRKMSKSLGNHIGVTDPPETMYGKTMSLPDRAMPEYYELLLGRPLDPATSPREAKRALARELVGWLHSPQAAGRAEQEFDRLFVHHSAPEEIEEHLFDAPSESVHLPALIANAFGVSRSEARRLIDGGGVSLDEQPLGAGEHDLPQGRLDGAVLRVGKRRFRRLRQG